MDSLLFTKNICGSRVLLYFFSGFFLITWWFFHHFLSSCILMGSHVVKDILLLMFWQILVTWVFVVDWVIKILRKILLKYDLLLTHPPLNLIFFIILSLRLFHFSRFQYLSGKVTLVIGNCPLHPNVFVINFDLFKGIFWLLVTLVARIFLVFCVLNALIALFWVIFVIIEVDMVFWMVKEGFVLFLLQFLSDRLRWGNQVFTKLNVLFLMLF